MKKFSAFATDVLVPASRCVLLQMFAAYKAGRDIGVDGKKDGSPASRADREAEQAMRDLITRTYPDHGIIGEEHASHRPDAEYVWVLDPLDGTREFLDRHPGWCTLIALLHSGKPILGVIDDPLNESTISSVTPPPALPLSCGLSALSLVACTNPAAMFGHTPWAGAAELFALARVQTRLNGLGFAHVATGKADIAVETGLKLHDIAALLPVLWAADAPTLRFDGSDYREYKFTLTDREAVYELLTGRDKESVAQAMEILRTK